MMNNQGFMHKNYKAGFSLVELVLALALVGTMSMIIVPTFFRRSAKNERALFVGKCNTLVRQAWAQALQSGVVQKVIIDLLQKQIFFEPVQEQETKQETHSIELPEQFEVHQCFVAGIDELSQHALGNTVDKVWFFITSDGRGQEVILNMIDTKDVGNSPEGKEVSLVLNPLRVVFEEYDTFQTPDV